MADVKKFDESDLTKLKDLQDRFNTLILQMGQVTIESIKINGEKKRLEDEYITLKIREKSLAAELTEKYGKGVLDPKTGEFTPQASQPETGK